MYILSVSVKLKVSESQSTSGKPSSLIPRTPIIVEGTASAFNGSAGDPPGMVMAPHDYVG